ncbi:MAG: GDSL-type esterase/lipase family protein [Planctomycetaceae bacterium]|jgi:lysophospholipase L1-like esterase|nr:GDSL-type esterase/lipase family protein [Planctomycetaceae bacterium]
MTQRIFFVFFLFSVVTILAQEVSDRNIQYHNFEQQFGDSAHVAFMGGSITEMNGYRPMVCEMLQKRFPETRFTFTAAGLSSTCSMTGAFRLEQDVLSKGRVDLFFVEFAVNDDQDAHHSEQTAIRGMEGIIRHLWRNNPYAGIVLIFFANEHLMDEYRHKREAVSIVAHRKVAEYYGISMVNVAQEVRQQIDEKKLTWQQYGGVHPAPYGNRLAANMIEKLFEQPVTAEKMTSEKTSFEKKSSEISEKHPPLPTPLDIFCYENGRFVSPDIAKYGEAWSWAVPDWKSISGHCRSSFSGQKLLCCDQSGKELTFEFDGKAVGAFVLAGPDAGIVEYQIDNQPVKQTVLFHHFSNNLHYPRTVMFDDQLKTGKHTLRLWIIDTVPPQSKGTVARILQFTVN